MRVGIFGNAGVGKSTLFRALGGGSEESPVSARAAGVCTIKVLDDRLDRLAAIFRPKKVTPISVTFVEIDPGDTALLSPEAVTGIKGTDVLAVVLRGFSDDFHPAPAEGLNPVKEFRAIESDLVISDYLVAQKRIERMTKEARRDAEWTILHKAVESLEREVPLRQISPTAEEGRVLAGFRFLSQIPILAVLNVAEADLSAESFPELAAAASSRGASLIRLSARIEEEISQLSSKEQEVFLAEMGIARPAWDRLVRGAFQAMDFVCFMTVGGDEVRAWNVRRGTIALHAAGKIHSDMEKGFIRAEVIPCDDFFRCGSMAKAKTEGKLRLEGKEYVLQEGDIMHVRFNV
jgi:GTP-binding protein YchF